MRELENIIERAIILTSGAKLEIDESLVANRGKSGASAHGETLQEVERHHILQVLEDTGWRIEGPSGAAIRLGLNPSTLRSRMKKLHLTQLEGHQ